MRKRVIPIHKNILPILKTWKENGIPTFYTKSKNYYHISCFLTNMFRLVGIALLGHEIIARDLRHSFQLRLENTNANPTQIAILLGNTPQGAGGRTYTHPTTSKLRNIIDQLQ